MPDDARRTIRHPWEQAPSEGTAVEVAPDILWMRLPLPMALDHVNVYALRDADGWTLVDTGFATGRTRALWSELVNTVLAGAPIARVLVTHHHPDHIGLAGWFQSQGAELLTTRTAWLMARMLVLDDQDRPTPETLAFWRGAGMAPDIYAKRSAERPFNFSDVVAPLPLGFTRIADRSRLTLGGRDWIVRIGHGHAPEQATLWSTDGQIVLGADQLLPSISPNLGVYATEPAADPVGEWLASCEGFQAHATDHQLVLPGHKLPYRGLPARLGQLIRNHHGALDRLLDHLAQPCTATECFPVLFKRAVTEGTYGLAMVEAMAHLNHLLIRKEVTRERRSDDAWLWRVC